MYDKSIAALNYAITLEPNNPVTYNNLGLIYTYSSQFNRAIEDFTKAIVVNQNYASAYYNRGDAYLRTGNKELAVSDFQKACALGSREACGALASVRTMVTPGRK
jgi:tetratricopeptide (TPR) repeat protein